MDISEGMVAVVQGLRDSSLAVTLLDGGRKYTLMPNTGQYSNSTNVQLVRNHPKTQECVGTDTHNEMTRCDGQPRCGSNARCSSGAQATDGRYASMYKMVHCHVAPTSPPVELTEFPPQRAEICPGHGNFEVGGAGSGDTYSPTRVSNSYRGGMSWSDRGAVCNPRLSHEPNQFANSLRKYPAVSPERSSEMVERLVNYTQAKNAVRNNTRSQTSPTRISEANSSQTLDRSSRITSGRAQKTFEESCRARKDESPTRDGRPRKPDCDCTDFRRAVFRNYDVRYLREMTKRAREGLRNMPAQNTNSVNMEIQAVVEMSSKEVATAPRMDPSKRNVAVPLSPAISTANGTNQGEDPPSRLFKKVQTAAVNLTSHSLGLLKSVQTSLSSIHLRKSDKCQCSDRDYRKSKSEEELRNRTHGESQYEEYKDLTDMYTEMCCDSKRKDKNKDRFKFRCCNYKNASTHSKGSNTWKILNNNDCYIAGKNCIKNTNCNIDAVINDWLIDIPIKNRDFLGRTVNREEVLRNVSNQLKNIVLNAEDENTLKCDVIKLFEDIPIDVNNVAINIYVKRLADNFLHNCLQMVELGAENLRNNRIRCDKNEINRDSSPFRLKPNVQSAENEIKVFIRKTLSEFLNRTHMKINSKLFQEVEIELIDLLIDSIAEFHTGEERMLKEDICFILHDIGCIPEFQAMSLADTLLERYKAFLNIKGCFKNNFRRSQAYVVLQNTSQITPHSADTQFHSLVELPPKDIENLLSTYIQQLSQEIDAWFSIFLGTELNFAREVAINDLAGDIVDRLKYLDRNPAKRVSDKDELEVLKFQIFKWFYKLVDKDTMEEAMNHTPDLMARIRAIPNPIAFVQDRRDYTHDNTLPSCCISQSPVKTKQFQPNSPLREDMGQYPINNNYLGALNFQAPFPNSSGGGLGLSNPSQLPILLENGGGSMIEPSGRRLISNRRQSSPGAFHPVPVEQDFGALNIDHMPVFGPTGAGGSMIDAPVNRMFTNRRLSAPGAFVSDFIVQDMPNANTPESHDFRKYNFEEMPMFGAPGAGGSMIESEGSRPASRRMSGPGTFELETRARDPYQRNPRSPGKIATGNTVRANVPPQINETEQSVDRINSQYDQYLKNWVKEIPLPISTTEEKTLADTIRMGFYNGVWKAILKIKLDPAKYSDRVYCQGVLDADIQELFDLLPQTQELESKKGDLKANLLQKTIDTIEQLLAKSKASNYRQQLVEQLTNHIPNKARLSTDSPSERYEELQKLKLIDAFILYANFRESDLIRANIYKKKLNQRLDEILKIIKDNKKLPLGDINIEIYKNEIMTALDTVPMPSPDVIRDEADEILLAMEIEKWYDDLPIVPNNDPAEDLDRRRIRNALAKQIHELGQQINLADDSSIEQIKSAVMRFLQKISLQPDQQSNLNFIAVELANRLKNRARENAAQRLRSASYDVPNLFIEFEQNVPGASSLNEINNQIGVYQSGTSVHGVGGYYPPDSIEYFTLPYTPTPPVVRSVHESQAAQPLPTSNQQQRESHISSRQQVVSGSRIQAGNRVSPAPQAAAAPQGEAIQMSHHGSIPAAQPMTVVEAGIPAAPQVPTVSRPPDLERSNHVVFVEPEIPIASPQVGPGIPQIGHISVAPIQQPVSVAPMGVLGTSQTAGSSGVTQIRRIANSPVSVPNIVVTTATPPRQYQPTQVVLSPRTADEPIQGQPQIQIAQAPVVERTVVRELPNSIAPQAGPVQVPGNYDDGRLPVAYSTTQDLILPPRAEPPPVRRKNPREQQFRGNGGRRRIYMDESEDSESEEVQCRCMEREYRCRRRRRCYDCNDYMMDCPRFMPMRYPYPCFY